MTEELGSYQHYKASRLSALGMIPSHWTELRAKYIFKEVDERSSTGREELLSVSHKTGVTPRSQKNVSMFLAKSNVGYKVCRPGDIAVNTMWAWMAALGVSRYTGLISPSYGVYRPNRAHERLHSKFIDELLRTEIYRTEYIKRSTGVNSSRLRLYPEHFLRIPLLIPPAEEQAGIVRYLAHVDQKINRSINAKRKLIELINEQINTVTHTHVTRGLSSNGGLKQSGVEWLGDIPAHWVVKPLKYIAVRSQNGSTPPTSDRRFYEDGSIPWYGPSSIGTDSLVGSPVRLITSQALKEGKARLINGPAVLVVVIGTIGRMALMPANGTTNQQITAFELNKNGLDPLFVIEQMRFAESKLRASASSATIPIISANQVARIPIALPPYSEQLTIMDKLRTEIAPLKISANRTKHEIGLLVEYRTRLVSDVVTGKLDVRSAAAKLPDLAPEAQPLDENEDLLQDETAAEDLEVAEAA